MHIEPSNIEETLKVVAAVLTTSTDNAEVEKSKKRFWKLYWGELALVENSQVEASMVVLGKALKDYKKQVELQQLKLTLARACRNSLDKSWGINAWSNPDKASNVVGKFSSIK